MTEVFQEVVDLSISASWLVVAVIIFRFVLKKASKAMHVLLWGVVAFRLLCPISFASEYSLVPELPESGVMAGDWVVNQTPEVELPDSNQNPPSSDTVIVAPETPEAMPNPGVTERPETDLPSSDQNAVVTPTIPWRAIAVPVLTAGWILGMILLALYAMGSYWLLYRRVGTAIRLRANIYQSEFAESPFVLGFFKPRIYLPFSVPASDMPHVIAHERAHISRRDHWWKPLGYILLTVHWFNPLMWVAYLLLCRDIELACDEKVVKKLRNEQRADYSQALLTCSVNRKMILACPVAFGEVGVKERVKNVLNYRKPGMWLSLLTAAAMVISLVCFATVQPARAEEPEQDDEIVGQPETVPAQPNRGSSVTLTTSSGIEYTVSASGVTPVGLNFSVDVDVACTFLIYNYYWIERQTETGWETLPATMEDPCHLVERFGASGIRWPGGPTDTRPVDWSGIYGVLEPGTYRLWTTVFEGEDPCSVEFTIGDFGDSTAAQALLRYYDALNALLKQESYHVVYTYSSIEDPTVDVDADTDDYNDMNIYEYMRSGDDYLNQEYTYTTDMLNDGFMIRDGVEYRMDNEIYGNGRTPAIGWYQAPAARTNYFTRWVYCFAMNEIASAQVTQDTAVLNLKCSGSELSNTVTITYDENSSLISVVQVAEYDSTSTREAYTSTYMLTVMDTGADAIAQRIESQDVEFCREFSWAEGIAEDEVAVDRDPVNTQAVTLDTVSQVIERARNECSVTYTNIMVFYDAEAMVWKVEFWVGYSKASTETVYLTDSGVTLLITHAGARL